MLDEVSEGIKIVNQTERFSLVVYLLRMYKITLLWMFGSRSLAFKHAICRSKAVKLKARVHSAKQGMFTGVECKKKERCYFPVSRIPHNRDCLRGVKIFSDLGNSGKNENLRNYNLNILSSWWLSVLCISNFYCFRTALRISAHEFSWQRKEQLINSLFKGICWKHFMSV